LSDQNPEGYSLISILFYEALNWPFVVTNQISSSQIFAYLPIIIARALDIPTEQVLTFALQVYIPDSYTGPSESAELLTMYLGYIPSEYVDELAAEIKAKQSSFYTGVDDPVAQDLASHVNSGFAINSVADPGSLPGGSSVTPNMTGATSSDDRRKDAIIGVVSALGAIAILVLLYLVYRSYQRRQELAHRRLSDPPDVVIGTRPAGREFDQDSVGGARRRSFYYAEDSLRGYQGERQNQDDIMTATGLSHANMTQRRAVVPGAISAPILRESSMNW